MASFYEFSRIDIIVLQYVTKPDVFSPPPYDELFSAFHKQHFVILIFLPISPQKRKTVQR